MSANSNPHPDPLPSAGRGRPDVLVGRKLPAHSLWEQLQSRAVPLALEFCAPFFNGELSYAAAQKWLAAHGLKISVTALQGFYNSMDMRLRYASLQAAQSAETARTELPADIKQATKDRIAQHKFELAFMNLGAEQRLQLIQIQQHEDGIALKRGKLDLEREQFQRDTCALFVKWNADQRAKDIAGSTATNADKIEQLGQLMFGEDWKR